MIDTVFLQINSNDLSIATPIIIAIGTIILALTTAYYAHQTRKTVDVMEKSAELSIMPHMKGHLIYDGPSLTYFRISNIGNGPANDIIFKFWFDSHPKDVKTWSNNILMPEDYKDFILLVPESKAPTDIFYFEKNQVKIHVQSTYTDIQGTQYSIDEEINATKFAQDSIASHQKIQYDPLKEIAKEIGEIKNMMRTEELTKRSEREFRAFSKSRKKRPKKKSKKKILKRKRS